MSYKDPWTGMPERPLDPPEPIIEGHTAVFECYIGDIGEKVHVTCEITVDGEIEWETAEVWFGNCFLNGILNKGHRRQIEAYFDQHVY